MTAIALWLGRSALMQSPIGGILKMIPRWLWILLAVAAAVLFAVHWHSGKIEDLRSTSFQAGYAKAVADGKQRVHVVEHQSETVSSEERKTAHEEIERNGRAADALRVRGPGAAACVNPGLPVGAGGSGAIGGRADDPLAGVPGGERQRLIALPFAETVDRAEIADANRTEVLAWRQWHDRLTEMWAEANRKAEPEGGKNK